MSPSLTLHKIESKLAPTASIKVQIKLGAQKMGDPITLGSGTKKIEKTYALNSNAEDGRLSLCRGETCLYFIPNISSETKEKGKRLFTVAEGDPNWKIILIYSYKAA